MEKTLKSFPILIADDDPEDRLLAREAIKEIDMGSDIRFVRDGEELLDYLMHRGKFTDVSESPRPGLILLDLNMPRMDGREALREIRSVPELKHIPVVILTTSGAEEDIFRTYESGANSFITKPVTYDGLINVMKTLKHYWFETVVLPNYE